MSVGTAAPVTPAVPVVVAPRASSPILTLIDRLFWVALVLGGVYFWDYLRGDHGNPAPAVDKTFVAIGRQYPKHLGEAYGEAWLDGAESLEGGKSIKDSLDVVTKAWSSGRTKVFEEVLTPAMAKIVAENQVDLSPSERAAMVRAWRGLAKGMSGK